MRASANQQRDAVRVQQQVGKTFQFHKCDQEQCKRGIFGKVRMRSHGSQELNISTVAYRNPGFATEKKRSYTQECEYDCQY